MNYKQYQQKIGWTNAQAADFFSVSMTTIKSWKNGRHEAPKSVLMCCISIITKKAITID